MLNIWNGCWPSRTVVGTVLGILTIIPMASAQQPKPPAQVRTNDFPSVRGYDPGYAIPYDSSDPYVALEYINEQFDGVWTDVDSAQLDVKKYFSHAPQAEDYSDENRKDKTPNTPHLTPEAAKVFSKVRTMILAGNNPAQAVGWCFVSHPPTTTMWNQFMFTPDSMNASLGGGGGNIYSHVYMDG